MKKCPKCQYPNPDNRTECFKCGVSLDGSAVTAQAPPPAEPPQVMTPQPGQYQGQQTGVYQGPPQRPGGYPDPNQSVPLSVMMPVSNKAPANRGLWVGLAILFVILMSGGIKFFMVGKLAQTAQNANKGTDPQNYTVVSCELENSGIGLPMVKGQILNNTNYNVRMASVTIDLYDANGQKIDETSDFTTEWTPHQNWIFEAMVTNPQAAGARISKVKMALLK